MKLRLSLHLAIGGARWPAAARLLLLTLFPLAVAAAADSGAAAQQPAMPLSIPVLMVSDVHFDPFMGMDSNAVAELAQAQPADWDKIFAKHFVGQANWGGRFDTSYQLWQTSLKTMKTHAAGVRFVTLSGDLMAHDFDSQFFTACGNGNCGDLASFAEKTIDYVLHDLRETLPGAPVYAALGNNDSPCHDYELTPGSEFLHAVGETITKDVPAKERAQAEIDFSGEGYYSVTLPAPMQNTRLLVVDDIFLASSYGPCPSGPQPPAGKPVPLVGGPWIPWLEKQLAAVRADKKDDAKAWVMGHIPSGVDPYDTVKKKLKVCGTGAKPPKMFLPTPDPGSPDQAGGGVVTVRGCDPAGHLRSLAHGRAAAALGGADRRSGGGDKNGPFHLALQRQQPVDHHRHDRSRDCDAGGLSRDRGARQDRRESEVDHGVRLCGEVQDAGGETGALRGCAGPTHRPVWRGHRSRPGRTLPEVLPDRRPELSGCGELA